MVHTYTLNRAFMQDSTTCRGSSATGLDDVAIKAEAKCCMSTVNTRLRLLHSYSFSEAVVNNAVLEHSISLGVGGTTSVN